MDIKRVKPNKKFTWLNTGIPLFLLLGFVFWFINRPTYSASLSINDVWIGTVHRGDLTARLEGFGILQSKYQRLLTAQVDATVEEVLLKPGADVNEGDIILRLINSDLKQELENKQSEVKRQQANLRQLELTQKRESLSLESQLAILESQYESAKLKYEAESSLVEKGIVSVLDAKRSELDVKQLKKRLSIEKDRLTQLNLVHIEAIKIQDEEINKHQGELETIQRRYDSLIVKSESDGVLQRLPVELGQRVNAGSQLALIGSVDELLAMIDIPQSQIGQVQKNQEATIQMVEYSISGKVTRIDPEVTSGVVKIEIELNGELPSTARPLMNVEATIETGVIKDTLYIERPVNAKPNSSSEFFVLAKDKQTAIKNQVSLGLDTGKYVQVLSGVKTSEKLILSDTSNWQQYKTLKLTQ